jgi:hypothetical protein
VNAKEHHVNTKLVVDSFSEFHTALKPWTVAEIWNAADHDFISNAVYLVERQRFVEDNNRLLEHINLGKSRFVFSLPFEGSETLVNHLRQYQLLDLVKSKKLLLISGGDMPPEIPRLTYDMFATKFHDFEENIVEADKSSQLIFQKKDKPYKFLFLNGRERSHRRYLVEKFDLSGLLDSSIWSFLSPVPTPCRYLSLIHNGINLISQPRSIKLLEDKYEVKRYQGKSQSIQNTSQFVKMELFNNEWGDIYVNSMPYIDTYFSLVTETVFNFPYSFRTEKIWKPIAMCHPWITVANCGYYRDLRNLGFRSFDHLIDESFDSIDNNHQRIDRIVDVVEDLCKQDLKSFLAGAEETCKYNQQRLLEFREQVQKEFPDRFFQFLAHDA